MPGTKKNPKPKKPTVLKIEIRGLRVELGVDDDHLREVLAAFMARVQSSAPAEATKSDYDAAGRVAHDFDVVRRVIEIADIKIVEAIVDLAKHEVERRQNAS
jgi:hypothetical protein